jgi:hypothetical protein
LSVVVINNKWRSLTIFGGLLFFILIVIHAPSLFKKPLWDDIAFIFQNSGITLNSNPFVFWIKESEHYKSWPIGYLIFWCLFKVFRENYYLWSLFAISLHFLNSLLFYKIVKDEKFKFSFIATVIFLFHPLHVETISWTIQINTLSAVLFSLLSYIYIKKYFLTWKKKKWAYLVLGGLLFAISLKVKPVAILLPFVLLISMLRKNPFLFLKRIKIFIPIALFGLFVVYKSMTGIHSSAYELSVSKVYMVDKVLQYKTPLEILEEEVTFNKFESAEEYYRKYQEYEQNKNNLLNPRRIVGRYLLKLNLMVSNSVFYLEKFYMPLNQMLFYPKNDFELLKVFFLCFVVGTTFCISVLNFMSKSYRSDENRFLFFGLGIFIAGFIPISGIAYIPFMKFSFVADHWGYIGAMGLSLFTVALASKYIKNRKIFNILMISFIVFLSIRTSYYSKLFNDHKGLISYNISQNPTNEFLYKYLGKLYLDEGYLAEAKYNFEIALQLSPGDSFAKRKLQEINDNDLKNSKGDYLDLYDHHSEPR